MTRQILREIIIQDYPDEIMISKERRAVPYVSKDSKVRGKKEIPRTFSTKSYKGKAPKYYFDAVGVLRLKKDNSVVLSNPRTAGEPRYWKVNFQQIWNGGVSGPARANRVKKLEEIIKPYIVNILPIDASQYPVKIEIFIHDTDFPVDASNKGVVYTKVIEDILTRTKVIEDDSAEYVNDTGRLKYIKISNKSDRKMIIRIIKSDNLPE